MYETVKQSVTIPASPKDVYDALLDSKKHSAFSGAKAVCSNKEGGSFSCFEGYIEGVNVKLVPDKLIVQAWRAAGWKESEYSIATFALSEVKAGTKISFLQTGVPKKHVESISSGWKEHYWDTLKAYFKGK